MERPALVAQFTTAMRHPSDFAGTGDGMSTENTKEHGMKEL